MAEFEALPGPGQVPHDSNRMVVLPRADGVVFVADSLRAQTLTNAESFRNLADHAARAGLDEEAFVAGASGSPR